MTHTHTHTCAGSIRKEGVYFFCFRRRSSPSVNSSLHPKGAWLHSFRFLLVCIGACGEVHLWSLTLLVIILDPAAAQIFLLLHPPFHLLMIVRPETLFYKPLGPLLGMWVCALFQCCVCLARSVAVVHLVLSLRVRHVRGVGR